MTLSFLRPALIAALVLTSLASCGGKASFEIAGTVTNQRFKGLVLTETFSGQTLTLNDFSTNPMPFAFPNTIDYGTEYKVVVTTNPPHQTCAVGGFASDSAGRMASINVPVLCTMVPHAVTGSIKLAEGTTGSYVGLKLINGSNDLNPVTISDAATIVYSYPGLTFDMPYGVSILAQPTDQTILCELDPVVKQALTDTPSMVSGRVPDADVVINIVCKKKAVPAA